jgi:hypothetical protein
MITTLRALTGGLLLLAVPIAAAGPREPVAIIYQVSGEPLRIAPGRTPEPLRLLDYLPAEATVELKAGSRLALAFVTGKRYELSGPARATLGKGDLAAKSGGVRALASVPPLSRLVAIEDGDHPGAAMGAIRIRAERITGLYPCSGAAALAGETILRFHPVLGAMSYQIEVQDGRGRIVFALETGSPPVRVPAAILRGGQRYWWTVRTLDRPGPVARGETELVTLSESDARARKEVHDALVAERPESLPLLAEIDRGLGLLRESRDELRLALDAEPGDPALEKALAAIERRLEK